MLDVDGITWEDSKTSEARMSEDAQEGGQKEDECKRNRDADIRRKSWRFNC